MVDMQTVSLVMTSLSTAVDLFGQLRAVSDKVKDAEAKNLIADLGLALADLKTHLVDLREENFQLRTEAAKLREVLNRRGTVRLHDGVYYEDRDGQIDGEPFCPRCFDVKELRVHLSTTQHSETRKGKFRCPECKEYFGPKAPPLQVRFG